ncbi:MAG: AI-2E family transporter [Candidatus Limnocylindrales bacterium]
MMPSPARRLGAPSPRAALAISAALLLGTVLLLGAEAIPPFVIGLLLVYLLDPAVSALARRGLPRWLGVLLLYLLVAAILIAAIALVIPPLARQLAAFVAALPGYGQKLQELAQQLNQIYEQLDLPPAIRDMVDRAVANLIKNGGQLDLSSLLPLAGTLAGQLARLIAYVIVPVWAFFLLKDRDRLLESLGRSVPEDWRADTWAVLAIIERTIGRWIRGQLLLGLVVGLATFVGLLILGVLVDPVFTGFAVLLGVIAGVLELVPIIGPIISMVPTLVLALSTGRWEAIVAVVLLYVIVQQTENTLLVPVIQGGAIDLHPAVVLFALIMGGAIAGLLGAILALPITAAARDVYRYLFRRAGPPPMAPEAASASLLPHGHGPMVRTAADAARRAAGGVAPASEPDPSDAGPTTAAEPTPAGPATAEVAPSSKPT